MIYVLMYCGDEGIEELIWAGTDPDEARSKLLCYRDDVKKKKAAYKVWKKLKEDHMEEFRKMLDERGIEDIRADGYDFINAANKSGKRDAYFNFEADFFHGEEPFSLPVRHPEVYKGYEEWDHRDNPDRYCIQGYDGERFKCQCKELADKTWLY